MTGANILDGDLVALERREPKPGDIIAALVDETDTTLKRLVREHGRLLLRAENRRYADIGRPFGSQEVNGESHQRQRRLQPLVRTNTLGVPASSPSPCSES